MQRLRNRKAILSKNEQSKFLDNVERSSLNLTTFVGRVALSIFYGLCRITSLPVEDRSR